MAMVMGQFTEDGNAAPKTFSKFLFWLLTY